MASFLFTPSSLHAALTNLSSGGHSDAAGDKDVVLGETPDGAAEVVDGAGPGGREPKRVLECLQRSLKIADACKVASMHTPLFVEALDIYLQHFSNRCAAITPTYITSLIQLIEQQLAEEGEHGKEHTQRARIHFDATKRYIVAKRASDPRFEEIQ